MTITSFGNFIYGSTQRQGKHGLKREFENWKIESNKKAPINMIRRFLANGKLTRPNKIRRFKRQSKISSPDTFP